MSVPGRKGQADRLARVDPVELARLDSDRGFCRRVRVDRCIQPAPSQAARAGLPDVPDLRRVGHGRHLAHGPDLARDPGALRVLPVVCCLVPERLRAELHGRRPGQDSAAADSGTRRAKKAR